MTESIDQPQTSESHDAVIAEALAVIDQASGVRAIATWCPAARSLTCCSMSAPCSPPCPWNRSDNLHRLPLGTCPRRGAVRLARARRCPRSPPPAVAGRPGGRAACTIHDGDRVRLRVGVAGVSADWIAEHTGFVRNEQFVDRMVRGPVRRWEHTHRFAARTACPAVSSRTRSTTTSHSARSVVSSSSAPCRGVRLSPSAHVWRPRPPVAVRRRGDDAHWSHRAPTG